MEFLKENRRGAVTVFTALILSAAILLNCVLLQGVYVYTACANLEYKLALTGKSLLASFDRILYEDYGLVACLEQEDAGTMAAYYFNGVKGNYLDSLTSVWETVQGFEPGGYLQIRPFQGESFAFTTAYQESLGDINVLQTNIVELMKYQSPANLLEYLLEYLDIIESAEETSEGERLYREAGELLDELSQVADKLYRTVEGWSEHDFSCVNGFDHVLTRSATVGKIKTDALLLQGFSVSDMIDTEAEKTLQVLKDNCIVLRSDYATYAELTRKALSYIAEAESIKKRIQPKVDEIYQWMEHEADCDNEMEREYVSKLKERVEELQAILRKTAYTAAKTKLESNLSILNGAIQKLEEMYAYLDTFSSQTPGESVFDSSYVRAVIDEVEALSLDCRISIYTGRSRVNENLRQEDPRAAGDSAQDNILQNMNALCEISKDVYDTLPSVAKAASSMSLEDGSLLKSALVDDYILSYFNNSGKGGSVSRYAYLTAETEYIVNGKSSDEDNIQNTFLKIFAVRSALNLLHVLCDGDKMEKAEAIGNAIAGALTCGIGGPLFTALVVAAWAMCEAGLDVEALKKGEEVPLIKTKETWRLSIAGLSHEAAGHADENTETAPFVMDYSGYLRLLLFMTSQKTKLLRIQDVIEVNLTQYAGKRTYIGDFCTAVNVGCSFLTAMPGPVYSWLQEDNAHKGFLLRRDVHVSY